MATTTVPPIFEKLRADAAAEVARLEAELERARAIELIFWTDPFDEKSQAYAEYKRANPLPDEVLAPATEGPIITPRGRTAVASDQRQAQFLAWVTEHPDTTMREFTDSIGERPTAYYRAAAKLVASGQLVISSEEGATRTYRTKQFRKSTS